MKKARARPRRIPAFGEWNYYDGGGGGGGGDWPVTQYFDSAMQAAGVVMDFPPSPTKQAVKKAVKWSDSPTTLAEHEHNKKHGAEKQQQQRKQSRRVADTGARKAVKAVDEDLYDIPPDMLCHIPTTEKVRRGGARRKKKRGSVWKGCLGGLGCIVDV